MKFKKRLLRLMSVVCACVALIFCGCDGVTINGEEYYFCDGFSVTYIDVGEGDATFIRFPDGKTMLIDCGEKDKDNMKSLRAYLSHYCKDGLDYLMITHPDSDHVGNAADVIEEYGVKTAFLPDLCYPESFNEYYAFYRIVREKDTEVVSSALYKGVTGEDYFMILLSPNPTGTTDSSYTALNDSEEPTAKERNNVSPIAYLEYKGIRFVFTGDADISQENVALNNVEWGFADAFLGDGRSVDLENIDFLKVGHHGSEDSTGERFLTALSPKNAVISVGANNRYGHPNTATLSRIYENAPDCKVLRTDISGHITIAVDNDGKVKTVTSAGEEN